MVTLPKGQLFHTSDRSRFPLHDIQGKYIPDLYDLYDLYDLAHVAAWEPYNLHDLARVSWVGVCTIQILRNIP